MLFNKNTKQILENLNKHSWKWIGECKKCKKLEDKIEVLEAIIASQEQEIMFLREPKLTL